MEKILSNKPRKNSLNIADELKEEKQNLKLTLRKNKINQILFTKRKISYAVNNNEEIRKKYSINIEELQISNELKIDIPSFLNNVRLYFIIYNNYNIQFDVNTLKEYLNSTDINLNLYGAYIIKSFLLKNNLDNNTIDILNDQLNDEYLLILTTLLNKNNIKLSYEILTILINVSYTEKGELLFGQEEKILFNLSAFLGNNKNDINLLSLGITLIKNITYKNSFVKQTFQKFNIVSFFNEIYDKFIFDRKFMFNLITCLGHFINMRFGDNNILYSIKIIKSQLNLNLKVDELHKYVYILYNLSLYNNPKVFENMIQYEIQKDLICIYPFGKDDFENKNKTESTEDEKIVIQLRLLILKILTKIMSSENNSITKSVIDSGLSKFLNKVLQSTDVKIIKNAFFCITNICAGPLSQLLNLYKNDTIYEAFKVSEYIYEALSTNNKFVDSLFNDEYIKAFREINNSIALIIINSLYDQIMPFVRNHNFAIIKILIKGIKIFSENNMNKNNELINFILKAISKLNSFIKNEDEEEIMMHDNNYIKFSEFLEQNGFKQIIENLLTNTDENIADAAEQVYEEMFNNNETNEDININDIIDDSEDNK